MYNAYYGFRESPFNLTPDSSFYFPSVKHKSAMDALVYGIQERKGFAVVTGEIGSGKTTVCRVLLRQLGENISSAVILNTHLSPKGIITMILEDLGIDYRPGTKEMLIIQLNQHLIEQAAAGRNVLVLVDEAQNLTFNCLEEIRMLSNLETEKEKLIQIILVGQPELRKKLDLPRLTQLKQRITVQYHLEPLDPEETRGYILHRLNQAKLNGHDYGDLFSVEAIQTIHSHSKGLPRLINKICDHSLLTAFVSESKTVTPSIVEEVAQELQFTEVTS